ncbi:imm11 family protein [Archangium sp.]|uniref:imm11 family protein n=1 Tax=Archangium sp. TaxID=1872627 RepID=UPI002ED8BE2D
MTRYFELRDDRQSHTRWHLGTPIDEQGQEVDPWQFKKGKVLELGCVPRFPLDVPGGPLDYCWAAFSIPVVHGRVVQIIEKLRVQDVQFIPARVDGHEGPYFILNALRIIRCIDETRCKRIVHWTPEDDEPEKVGQYRVVSGMRIDPTRVGDAHLFRPWGWRVALVISEELKLAMEAEGITGTRFVEV